MHYITKALVQNIFSYMPYGEKINYLSQRWITRSLPFSDAEFFNRVDSATYHL